MKTKTPSESYTEQVHMINTGDLNGYKRLFGGQLMSWIDTVAGIVAKRHCETNVTTVTIDNLYFIAPAHANDIVVLCGKATYTGKTSMEVRVDSYVEHLGGERELINKAYVVMVALDENEMPTSLPKLTPTTEEEQFEYNCGQKRRELRIKRQKEQY